MVLPRGFIWVTDAQARARIATSAAGLVVFDRRFGRHDAQVASVLVVVLPAAGATREGVVESSPSADGPASAGLVVSAVTDASDVTLAAEAAGAGEATIFRVAQLGATTIGKRAPSARSQRANRPEAYAMIRRLNLMARVRGKSK
jgi:hypothetical protein